MKISSFLGLAVMLLEVTVAYAQNPNVQDGAAVHKPGQTSQTTAPSQDQVGQQGRVGQSQGQSSQSTAQFQGQPGQSQQIRPGGVQQTSYDQAQQGGGNIDQHIAACLYLGNEEEIALAKFGQERAQHDQVKQFAKMLEQDHQQLNQKLQQIAPKAAQVSLSGQGQQQNQDSQATNSQSGQSNRTQGGQAASGQGQVGTQGQQQGQGQQQLVALARDTHQRCLELTKKELEEKDGKEFDKAFIGSQIGAHIGTLAKLEASEKHASGQLKQMIGEAKQKVEHHLQQAKDLMKTLEQA